MGLTAPPQNNLLLQNLQSLWRRPRSTKVIAPVKKKKKKDIYIYIVHIDD
jgi:hypothetical protein